MLRAVIFDFNGVIADDEPIHFELFARVMAEEGIQVSRYEYDRFYLHLNDHDAFETGLTRHSLDASSLRVDSLIRRKTVYYNQVIQTDVNLFPDVADFIRKLSDRLPLAIASGALQAEIETILGRFNLLDRFPVIIGAEKVVRGKPFPDSYLEALKVLNRHFHSKPEILAGETLVIEDSIGGVTGARRAGMKCLAVTNSYPGEALGEADLIVRALSEVNLNQVAQLFEK